MSMIAATGDSDAFLFPVLFQMREGQWEGFPTCMMNHVIPLFVNFQIKAQDFMRCVHGNFVEQPNNKLQVFFVTLLTAAP